MIPLFSVDRKTIEHFCPVALDNQAESIQVIFIPGQTVPGADKPIPEGGPAIRVLYQKEIIGPDNRVDIGKITAENIGKDPIIIYVRHKEF